MEDNTGTDADRKHADINALLDTPAQDRLGLPRRSSLDRSYSMPASSWVEGDQVLRDYRLRKAARESARRRDRASLAFDGDSQAAHDLLNDNNGTAEHRSFLSNSHRLPVAPPIATALPNLGGSAPPTASSRSVVRSDSSSPARSRAPSLAASHKSHSSTLSAHRASALISSETAHNAAALTGRMPHSRDSSFAISYVEGLPPSSASEHGTQSVVDGLPRPMLSRSASSANRSTRHSSAGSAKSAGVSRPGSARLPSQRSQTSISRESITHLTPEDPRDDPQAPTSPTAPSIIVHSEPASSVVDLAELEERAAAEAKSLDDQLRKRKVVPRDDTAYGIPKSVVIDGKVVDISDMDILVQVEMLRQAEAQKREARIQEALQRKSSLQEALQNIEPVELSDILEVTECETYSRRSTIAPTSSDVRSVKSQSILAGSPLGRQLAPVTHVRSQKSMASLASRSSSPARSVISNNGSTAGAAGLSQAEKIRQRYLRQQELGAARATSSASSSTSVSVPIQPAPTHRKYVSVDEVNFHSFSPSNAKSARSARATASEGLSSPSSNSIAPVLSSPTKSSRGRGVHPLSSAYVAPPLSDVPGQMSPSKRALSPVIATRMAQFGAPGNFPSQFSQSSASVDPYTSSLARKRSKSMHADDRVRRQHVFGTPDRSSSSLQAVPPASHSAMPISKSTSALVQLYEAKATLAPEPISISPVKSWLNHLDSSAPLSPTAVSTIPSTISSASGSMIVASLGKKRLGGLVQPTAAAHVDLPAYGQAAATVALASTRKRSQTLSSASLRSPQLISRVEVEGPSAAPSSFDEATVVHHGDLFWLNSSSSTHPPFWQTCRAILTHDDELRVSWVGAASGRKHERFFSLKTCTSAHSIRRATNIANLSFESNDPEAVPATKAEVERLQVFELVWPGRTQRFATISLPTRIKWLGIVFSVLSKYSEIGSPAPVSTTREAEDRTIGSATVQSLDLSGLSASPHSQVATVISPSPSIRSVSRRELAKEEQDTLYASVSEMLSPGGLPRTNQAVHASARRKHDDLPDLPRVKLRDPENAYSGYQTPLYSPVSVAPRPLRGAWSDTDRASTQSDPIFTGAPPAARTVARDLKRILTMVGKTRTLSASSQAHMGQGFPEQMQVMQSHLERISRDIRSASIASKHSRHAPEMVSKMDELLMMCQRLLEEKPKVEQAIGNVTTSQSRSPSKKANQSDETAEASSKRQSGLMRLEERMETLLEVVNRIASQDSPAEKKNSTSPERALTPKQGLPVSQAPAAPMLVDQETMSSNLQHASQLSDNLPLSTPRLLAELRSDFDQDLKEWDKHKDKRNSALPPLPGASTDIQNRRGAEEEFQPDFQRRGTNYNFYRAHIEAEHARSAQDRDNKSISSADVSSNYIRNARSDAAMRLEGSHPDLVQKSGNGASFRAPVISKWSADTPADGPSRVGSGKRKQSVKMAATPAVAYASTLATRVRVDDEIDSSPPTPKARDFAARALPVQTAEAVAVAPPVDNKLQESMAKQLNSMQDLLQTLVAAQAKQSEALKHQEDVSVYIKHLQEYLTEDRAHRKEEFDSIKIALGSISQQLTALPKEIQTLVEASLAVAVLKPHEPTVTFANEDPTPAPDTDQPDDAATIKEKHASAALNASAPTQSTKSAKLGNTSQSKGTGSSLLRKVSLGLAGLGGGGGGHPGIKVGGPRKMGSTRIFGHPPAPNADSGKDRWNKYKAASDPAPGPDMPAPVAPDSQAPLIEALEGFEKQLAQGDDETGENNDQATVIALGILEILKMMKEIQARDHEREHYRREDEAAKDAMDRERHAIELDAIRLELRDWEAKRAELEAENKDPQNREGIDTIIALLKDQMTRQEEALVNLKDTLSPQINDIGVESEEAILAMREEMTKNVAEFRAVMDEEVKKALDEVGALRDQKKQLQSDLSELLAFKSKYGGGAPENVAAQQQQQQQQHLLYQQQQAARAAAGGRLPYPETGEAVHPPAKPNMPAWGLRGPR